MKTIYIDTTSNKEVLVGLIINDKKYLIKQKMGERKAQVVILLIEELLNKHKLTIKDITGIQVNTGPGSFTGLRVGVAVANTLAFVLKISVNEKKIGEFVEPVYE